MNKTNLELLVALVKVKKLHLADLEKKIEKSKDNDLIGGIYSSMFAVNKTEVKVLSTIIASEEKNG